jgi:hypothetical protein
MATSVTVFPRTRHLPTFEEVRALAQRQLHAFLANFDLPPRPEFSVELHHPNRVVTAPSSDSPATWPDDTLAWFSLTDTPGGTDVHYRDDPASIRDSLECEISSNPRFAQRAALVRACADTGRSWTCCRYGGAVALTNVSYGIIAASFATLTDGLLHSDDHAWNPDLFPATPAEFLSFWYNPARATLPSDLTWSTKVLAAIRAVHHNPNALPPTR